MRARRLIETREVHGMIILRLGEILFNRYAIYYASVLDIFIGEY